MFMSNIKLEKIWMVKKGGLKSKQETKKYLE